MTNYNEFDKSHPFLARKIVTRYDVEALVDNELSWDEAGEIMAAIKEDQGLQEYYEQLKMQKQLLMNWWAEKRT